MDIERVPQMTGRTPISRQIRNKVGIIRRTERRITHLTAEIRSAESQATMPYPTRDALRLPELRRQLAAAQRSLTVHRTHLTRLQAARADGRVERAKVNRQTASYASLH